MPLSKARNRKRMQELRDKQSTVQPTSSKKPTKQELQDMIQQMESGQPKEKPKEEFIPWYNPQRHKTGDKVRIYDDKGQMQIVIVPELDAEGHTLGGLIA